MATLVEATCPTISATVYDWRLAFWGYGPEPRCKPFERTFVVHARERDHAIQHVLRLYPELHCAGVTQPPYPVGRGADALRQARRQALWLLEIHHVESFFPRLVERVRRAANLTRTEAASAIWGYLQFGTDDLGSEAVAHFGGSLRAIQHAWLRRRYLR
jgi:hypothetical protein